MYEMLVVREVSIITMISSEYTGYNYFMSQCAGVRDSAQRFTDS